MSVIVLANQKGGVGKTTLAAHLAVAALKAGDTPVAVVDLDPQGSLASWSHKRPSPGVALKKVSLDYLEEAVADIARQFKAVFIDTPPQRGDIIEKAIRVADMVVCPCCPSPLDVESLGSTLQIVTRLRKPFASVITRDDRTTLTTETREALAAAGPVAETTLRSVKEARVVMGHGLTALDLDVRTRLAEDAFDIWKEIRDSLPAPSEG